MSEHMLKEIPSASSSYIPSARSTPPGGRRNFSAANKRRIVEETCREGASVSGVARKYDIGTRLLFSWKKELTPETSPGPTFLPVTLVEGADQPAGPACVAAPAPVIVERPAPGIEIELIGGRRVRFERDVDPETVRRLVSLLEGEAR
jgi:transposase